MIAEYNSSVMGPLATGGSKVVGARCDRSRFHMFLGSFLRIFIALRRLDEVE